MPNRLIKDSILTSPNLNELSDLAERHFYRLLLISDDWGCFESTPFIIKNICYPRKDNIVKQDVAEWQRELEEKEIIRSWEYNNRVYSQFVNFEKHNALNEQHSPKTPCPPWVLNENNIDSRLATDTLQAFNKICVAIKELSSNGKTPTYRQIREKTKCSMSTISKYMKQAQNSANATVCYSMLPNATDATHKTPNPNPNPNPIESSIIGDKGNTTLWGKYIENIGATDCSIRGEEQEMNKEQKLSSNPVFAEIQKYVGFPDLIPIDPITNYKKESGTLKQLREKNIQDADIIQCWKDIIDSQNKDYVSLAWVNNNIFNWFKNGKKFINYKNNGHKPNSIKVQIPYSENEIRGIEEIERLS